MRSSRSSTPKRLVRALHHAVFVESRQGRAAEIAAWANGASACAVALGATALAWSHMAPRHAACLGLGAGAVTLLLLRLALAHRLTVWIASAIGTVTIAALGGSLAWLFAHVLEIAAAPPIAALIGALGAALAPAWGYGQLVRLRAELVRDSLLDPLGDPRSR